MACSSCAKKAGLRNNRIAAKYQQTKKKLELRRAKKENFKKQNEDKNSEQ